MKQLESGFQCINLLAKDWISLNISFLCCFICYLRVIPVAEIAFKAEQLSEVVMAHTLYPYSPMEAACICLHDRSTSILFRSYRIPLFCSRLQFNTIDRIYSPLFTT